MTTGPRPSDCNAGDRALERGSWSEAREAFDAALYARESPEALGGLGTAAWWLDQASVVFEARELAYQEATIVLFGQGSVDFKFVNPSDDPRSATKGTK